MVLTRDIAFVILQLPKDADKERIKAKYKQLAFEWHPEKHNSSHESVKQFKQITQAYRLLAFNNPQEMTMPEARKLFSDTYFSNSCVLNGVSDDSTSSDDDSDDSEISRGRGNTLGKKKDGSNERTHGSPVMAEEPERNGDNITEEERERKKAEKRRLKKKRRKEKKKLEKQEQKQEKGKNQKNKANEQQEKSKKSDKKPVNGTTSDDQAEFDPESAFFTKAVSKKKKTSTSAKKEKISEQNGAHTGEEEIEEVDSTVLRSRQLAIRGNEMAQVEEYTAAIQLFTEAIALVPTDFRFLGNRSYCYDRQQQYEKALKDAEKAIKLSKDWPKGYFRKGRALAGLNRFQEAEESFLQVLKLDKSCEEAVHELEMVRVRQLTDMGFTPSQASAAIKKHATVQAALESLLAGTDESLAGEVYISDEEDFAPSKNIPLSKSSHPQNDTKMDPKNPEGLTALWVGNVLPQVTERRLSQLFSKYGPVVSVRLLPEKYCAFVNYKLKESAGKAMQSLQGYEIEGQRLLIRFPDNPVNTSTSSITLRKSNPTVAQPSATSAASAKSIQSKGVRSTAKMSGPVNGDECYFWRTTGCDYGDNCRYRHVPQHKGVDKRPWQK